MTIINRYQKQAANLSIYLLASLIPMMLSVLINPLIALNMSAEDFAIVGYYTAFNTLFTPVVTFYLTHYYTKKFFELSDERRKYLKSTILISLITFSFIVAGVLLCGLYGYIVFFNTNSEIPFLPFAPLAVFALPLTGIYSLTLVEYRMQRKSKEFFWISIANGLLNAFFILLMVVLFKWGASGKLLSTIAGSLIIFLWCLYLNRDFVNYKFDRRIFKESVVFCFPLVIAAMLGFFSGGYDKIILERTGDLHALGIYVVGVSIASYLNVFTNSINDTFQPDVFQSIVARDFKRCAKIIMVKVALISIVVVAFIIAAPLLIKILTANRYNESAVFAMIVSVSSITSMLYYSFSQVTIAMGFTGITLINKGIGGALCILLYYILINGFGAYGAAWGIVASYLVFFLGNVALFFLKIRNNPGLLKRQV